MIRLLRTLAPLAVALLATSPVRAWDVFCADLETGTIKCPDPFASARTPWLHPRNEHSLVRDRATFPLSGATSAPGPDDFQSALAFDASLAEGESLVVGLRRTIAVPEPARCAGAGAAVLALLAWWSRRAPGQHQRTSQRTACSGA